MEVYGVKFWPLRPEVLLTRTQFEIYILKGSSSTSYITEIELEVYIFMPLFQLCWFIHLFECYICCCEYLKLVVDIHKKLIQGIHSHVVEPPLLNPKLAFPAI